jgi:hypothetical protein
VIAQLLEGVISEILIVAHLLIRAALKLVVLGRILQPIATHTLKREKKINKFKMAIIWCNMAYWYMSVEVQYALCNAKFFQISIGRNALGIVFSNWFGLVWIEGE